MKLEDMSWDEAVERCRGKVILVPHGSTEEHGYHLPLKTDALIAEKVCETFYDSREVVVAPVMRYTGVRTTKQIPGTVGQDAQDYEACLRSVISDFLKLKPKRIIFFLAHDGNSTRAILNELIKEFGRDKLDYISVSKLNSEAENIGITGTGSHAGEGETSLALYLDPKHVKMSRAVDELWPDKGISKSGVDGYPTKATAKKGKLLLEFYIQKVKEILT